MVAILGIIVNFALYSHWFQTCCIEALRGPLAYLLLPGWLIGMVIGGGVHAATAAHYAVGTALEFVGLWGLFRGGRALFMARGRRLTNGWSDRDT